MRRLWDFIQHNNAVPIGLFILFGGTGAVFAASPDTFYESVDTVQSVDNTYIVEVDLEDRDFDLEITDITEDDDNYYVSYQYNTISIVDYVWQEVLVQKSATYSKKELTGRDLGLFLAKQLGEELTAEIAYLKEVQKKEQENGATHKKVAREYRGLIGSMFDPTEREFDDYKPVVKEDTGVESGASAAAALAGAGETHDALPNFEAFVAQAVANALAAQNASSTGAVATSTASTTPPTEEPDEEEDDGGNLPTGTPTDTSTSTPPVDTATTTPPADAATSTPPTEEPADDTASSTPPVVEEPEEPAPDPDETPAPASEPDGEHPPTEEATSTTP